MKYLLAILLVISANAKLLSFADGIEIKKSGGYAEGAYVEWTGPTSDKYTVYVKEGS